MRAAPPRVRRDDRLDEAMAAAKPSDSSRNAAGLEALADREKTSVRREPKRRPKRGRPPGPERAEGPYRPQKRGAAPPDADAIPGLEMLTRALPFTTIPDEPLREHFTRWLVRSLISGDGQAADAAEPPELPAAAPTAAPPQDRNKADPLPPERQVVAAPPRPKFVKRGDGAVWVTKAVLRSRGWTDAAVRDFLPEPEGLKPNPRFAATGAPMPVWRPATVAAAEHTTEWQDWLERSLRRRQKTLEVLAETADEDFRARLNVAKQAIEREGAKLAADDARPWSDSGAHARERRARYRTLSDFNHVEVHESLLAGPLISCVGGRLWVAEVARADSAHGGGTGSSPPVAFATARCTPRLSRR